MDSQEKAIRYMMYSDEELESVLTEFQIFLLNFIYYGLVPFGNFREVTLEKLMARFNKTDRHLRSCLRTLESRGIIVNGRLKVQRSEG